MLLFMLTSICFFYTLSSEPPTFSEAITQRFIQALDDENFQYALTISQYTHLELSPEQKKYCLKKLYTSMYDIHQNLLEFYEYHAWWQTGISIFTSTGFIFLSIVLLIDKLSSSKLVGRVISKKLKLTKKLFTGFWYLFLFNFMAQTTVSGLSAHNSDPDVTTKQEHISTLIILLEDIVVDKPLTDSAQII